MFEWIFEKVTLFDGFGLRIKGYYPTKIGTRYNRYHRWTVQPLNDSWGIWHMNNQILLKDKEIIIDGQIIISCKEARIELRPYTDQCLYMCVDNHRFGILNMMSIIYANGHVQPVALQDITHAFA
jgi:hypothetical protein